MLQSVLSVTHPSHCGGWGCSSILGFSLFQLLVSPQQAQYTVYVVILRQKEHTPNEACFLFPQYEHLCKYYCIISRWPAMLTCLSTLLLHGRMHSCGPVCCNHLLPVRMSLPGFSQDSSQSPPSLTWARLHCAHIPSSLPSSIHGPDFTAFPAAQPQHQFLSSSFLPVSFCVYIAESFDAALRSEGWRGMR